jgi:hypothetical protein
MGFQTLTDVPSPEEPDCLESGGLGGGQGELDMPVSSNHISMTITLINDRGHPSFVFSFFSPSIKCKSDLKNVLCVNMITQVSIYSENTISTHNYN